MMLKRSLAATALLSMGLTACLEDSTGPQCQSYNNPITEERGDTIVTQIGLRYIQTGTGASQLEAQWCSAAQVQYRGTLVDGTVFDPGEEPLTFTPGASNIITGFQFGVVGMKIGEQRQLIIPPDLGYGSQTVRDRDGVVVIPPNSTLIFDIELISTQ